MALGRHFMAIAAHHAAACVAQELRPALAEAQHEGRRQGLQAQLVAIEELPGLLAVHGEQPAAQVHPFGARMELPHLTRRGAALI